jgi:hypothetical protein
MSTDVLQHQFCIKTDSGDQCSELDSLPRSVAPEKWKTASSVQFSVLQLLVQSLKIYGLVQTDRILAQNLVQKGIVTDQIPQDQWITEARTMESSVWAALQVSLADYAVGLRIRSAELADYVVNPVTSGDKELCNAQKMRKAGGFV